MSTYQWKVNPEHEASRFKFFILDRGVPVAQVVSMSHARRCVENLNEWAEHPLSYEGLIEDALYFDGRQRYNDTDDFEMFINPDDYAEESQPGDVYGSTDIALRLPDGSLWRMDYQQALLIGESLLSMAIHSITRPWSAEDPSTVIDRGLAVEDQLVEEAQAAEQGRELLRPVERTAEISSISDYHA